MRLISERAGRLQGKATVPGDKSISHRSLMFGAMAAGATQVTGILKGEDVVATAHVLEALGIRIERGEQKWTIHGHGVGGLMEPDMVLDFGNSGTSVRLMAGLLAGHGFSSFCTGDASLRSRPMARIATPLQQMGADFLTRSGGRLPMVISGSDRLTPFTYESPVASAQIKSAILLAGLHAPGRTTVIEPEASRDHTEKMLTAMGAEVTSTFLEDGRLSVCLTGQPELKPMDIVVPGDPSSAAFPMVAALILQDSDVTLRGVGMNPLRTGLFTTLMEMGADITMENERISGGEPVADLRIKGSTLRGVDVPEERVPSMIDEFPILAVAAACAEGRTTMRGLAELRVKESDRLSMMVNGLRACGVDVESGDDWMIVTGGTIKGGAHVNTHLDHRIAMSFSVLGAVASEPVSIDGADTIMTSFPTYISLMQELGLSLRQVDDVTGQD